MFALSLDLWGIRTFGQFAKLPALGVAARLGQEGIALHEMALGRGHRRLTVAEDALVFEAELELDSPIELLDSLCFVFARLLEELLARLAPFATNELRLTLALEHAPDHVVTLRLPVPMSDVKSLLKLLHLELAGNPPREPVVKVGLRAEPVKPRRTQRGLFAASSPEAERLETTLARVRHLVGKENVGSPYLLNTHRPDRFVMHPFLPPAIPSTAIKPPAQGLRLCLRRFRPPFNARVKLEERRPVHLSAPGIWGIIVTARGPWRMSGNWWTEDAWNRDRWDVALDSGVLYRLFQEIDSGRWFVEGSYD
jgi:protein ImuB